MKDLTHYFSPSKVANQNSEEHTNLPEVAPVVEPEETVTGNEQQEKTPKRRKKKKVKRRKPSDPAVKTITDLLTNSLTIISPNSSLQLNEITPEKEPDDTKQIDAFSFLMNSRHKSIGQNSEGKELNQSKDDKDENSKLKLSARKRKLKNWADSKGDTKRKKLEEESKGLYIEKQLDKRAKRLKKLLQIESGSTKNNKRKKFKKITRIESDSEEDFDVNEPSELKTQVPQNELEKEVTESAKETIKIKMFSTPKHETKKRKSLLSLKKEVQLEAEPQDSEIKTPKKKHKHKQNKLTEPNITPRSWKMKIKLSDNEGGNPLTIQNEPIEIAASSNSPLKSNVLRDKNDQNSIILIEDDEESFSSRRCMRVRKQVLKEDEEYLVTSGSDDEKARPKKTPVKVAPVFMKATKVDPLVAEAKRKFLLSGIPEKLKILQETQQSFDEIEFDVFPKIQHVYQQETSSLWNLPSVNLKCLKYKNTSSNLKPLEWTTIINKNSSNKSSNVLKTRPEKIRISKQIVQEIKQENPNYPVYKVFKSLYEKSFTKSENKPATPVKKKRGRKPKIKKASLDVSVEIIEPEKVDPQIYAMWTEKYKPRSSGDILGNNSSVTELKKWLERWSTKRESKPEKKRTRNSSESDFEGDSTDCDSRDSVLQNTIILRGPHGSGKTCAVYAICEELDLNVIEINASSKRTGKRVLQELQEATQSHQVRKNNKKHDSFSQFLKNKPKESVTSDKKRSCVLLFEDVDVVFEQDEGFVSSLSQLTQTSKRPIVMTTTDDQSSIIQKFIQNYPVLTFYPLSPTTLATWLKILCLIEGVLVDVSSVGQLLETYKGDVRKTMLQLQFWTQSGGNFNEVNPPLFEKLKLNNSEKIVIEDDASNLSILDGCDKTNTEVRLSVYKSVNYEDGYVPELLNLGKLWWNIPNLLNLPKVSKYRLEKLPTATPPENENSDLSLKKLQVLSGFYDSLALVDVMLGKNELIDIEPCVKQWDVSLKDSLELGEDLKGFTENSSLSASISHVLLNGFVSQYKKLENYEGLPFNEAVPSAAERRWRAKQHLGEDTLQDALNYCTFTERKSVALDYMPTLRHIARTEQIRAKINNKRGNRFNHYLKNLGVKINNEVTSNLICNILKF